MSAAHPAGQLFQLDRDHCLFLLATKRVGLLVGGNHDSPVVVLNYALRGGEIVARIDADFRTATVGTEVTFEVAALDERTRSGWSVSVRGVARGVSGTPRSGSAVGDTGAPEREGRWIAIEIADVTGHLVRDDAGAALVDARAYL